MAQVTILCGPAGSGKTTAVLNRCVAHLAAGAGDPLRGDSVALLTASPRQRQELSRRLLEAGAPGLYDPRLFTISSLAEAVLEAEHEPARRLSASQRQLLLQDVVRGLYPDDKVPGLGPIASLPGFINGLGRLIEDLKAAQITSDEWRALSAQALPGQRLNRVLENCYRAYQDRLHQIRVHDDPGLLWALVNLLQTGPQRPVDGLALLLVDGFDRFNPGQLRLLQLLAGQSGETVVTLCLQEGEAECFAATRRTLAELRALWPEAAVEYLPPPAPTPLNAVPAALAAATALPETAPVPVSVIGAPGPLAEVREVARLIKELLLDNTDIGPQDCAVVARSLEAYATPLAEVFAACGLPLELPQGLLLGQAPIVQAVLDVLAVPAGDYQREDVVHLLNSNYLDPARLQTGSGSDPLSAAVFERVAREAQVIGGREHWTEQFELLANRLAREQALADQGLSEDAEGNRLREATVVARQIRQLEQARGLFNGLTAILDPLVQAPEARVAVVRLGEALDRLGLLDRAQARPEEGAWQAAEETFTVRDRAALHRLLQLLREYGEAPQVLRIAEDASAPGTAFAALHDYLREAATSERLAAGRPWGGAVTALTAADAGERRFAHVFVLGLREGEFPRHGGPDALYGDRDRQRLRAAGRTVFRLHEERRENEALLFYRALSLATTSLTLTWPTSDASGRQQLRSPFLDDLLALLPPAQRVPRVLNRGEVLRPWPEATSTRELLAALDAGDAPADLAQLVSPVELESVRRRAAVEGCRASGRVPEAHDGVLGDPRIALRLAADTRFGPGHRFSASQFDGYAGCPMQFFLQRVLKLQALESPDEDLQVMDLGNLMHRVLANFFSQRPADQQRDPLSAEDLATEDQRLRECLQRAWEETETRGLLPHKALAALLRQAVERDLLGVLAYETTERYGDKAWLDRIVLECEQTYEIELWPEESDGLVVGRIDRIDEVLATGALRVYDYKSGGGPSGPAIARGLASQLPLYLRAVKSIYPDRPLDECGYYRLRGQAKCSSRGRGEEKLQELMDSALWYLRGYIAALRAGRFPPLPSGGCPSYCDFRGICRYTQTRLEGKAALPPVAATNAGGETDHD